MKKPSISFNAIKNNKKLQDFGNIVLVEEEIKKSN